MTTKVNTTVEGVKAEVTETVRLDKRYAKKLTTLRKQLGLDQGAVAKALGVSQSTLSQLERGTKRLVVTKEVFERAYSRKNKATKKVTTTKKKVAKKKVVSASPTPSNIISAGTQATA